MKIIKNPSKMQKLAQSLKKKGKTVAVVPTMGALHEGHLSLIKKARKENDIVIVSIFVNPAQFGPNEDYLKYPRPFSFDSLICKRAGADFIFNPEPKDMYPEGYHTYINVEKITEGLCGKFRPGHFRGVATVVAKLFNITLADRGYFGMKDFQQLKVIERMVKDLNMTVKIVPCPIVREVSGLAKSSRNTYLSQDEFDSSARIYETLQLIRDLIKYSEGKTAHKIKQKLVSELKAIPGSKIDYAEIFDPETFEPADKIRLPVSVAVAVWVGKTRLIDNILIKQ